MSSTIPAETLDGRTAPKTRLRTRSILRLIRSIAVGPRADVLLEADFLASLRQLNAGAGHRNADAFDALTRRWLKGRPFVSPVRLDAIDSRDLWQCITAHSFNTRRGYDQQVFNAHFAGLEDLHALSGTTLDPELVAELTLFANGVELRTQKEKRRESNDSPFAAPAPVVGSSKISTPSMAPSSRAAMNVPPVKTQIASTELAIRDLVQGLIREELAARGLGPMPGQSSSGPIYRCYEWGGALHPVPASFVFPQGNIESAWEWWRIGMENQPPIRLLQPGNMATEENRELLLELRDVMAEVEMHLDGRGVEYRTATTPIAVRLALERVWEHLPFIDHSRAVADEKRLSWMTIAHRLRQDPPHPAPASP